MKPIFEGACEAARDFTTVPPNAMRRTRSLARAYLAAIYEREERATWEAFVDDWFLPETQGALRAMVEKLLAKRKS